ncbi:methylamine utilization protein [Eurybiavirus PHM1]|uniref:Methylamine utilization protein n=1 Tax=Prochlorococcus phage P-HM1 TaxID=445700 RepID=E3SMV9_9CAUD|nr:methylamine utilization [Prochlorococcus phage P-HM1]ADO98752.1 methylamine utilization protein [Prochlorococcus phage P-HM1]
MKKTLIMNSLMSQSRRVMDKTEFLAAIKLVSGEELLSMVTSVHDENGDYLIVENPIEVEEVMLPNKQAGAKVQPWMKFSREEQFVIPKEHIITIVEVAEEVAVFYHMSLRKLNTDFITDAKGKISTVDEARIKLDKIFKKGT